MLNNPSCRAPDGFYFIPLNYNTQKQPPCVLQQGINVFQTKAHHATGKWTMPVSADKETI
jgi:hypothetical protein